MSFNRSALSSYLSDTRAERLALVAAANTLVIAGRYDRAAIMRMAVRTAGDLRAGGKPWSWRMSMGLRAAWRQAKEQMAAPAPAPPPPPRTPSWVEDRPAAKRRPTVFLRGSRIHSHGW